MTDCLSIGHFRRENCRAMLDYYTQRWHDTGAQFYADQVDAYRRWQARIEAADAVGDEPPPLVVRDVRALG